MPVILSTLLSLLGNILGGWAIKMFLNQKNLERIIIWSAERLVKKTDTPHDDAFLEEIKLVLADPKGQEVVEPKAP